MKSLILLSILLTINVSVGLDNGLALKPPLGWMSWQRFRCIIDCVTRPDECISEKLITRVADSMVSEGFAAAGYEYIVIDDCWLEAERDGEGKLVPDRERFPNGMKFIGDYIHSKGLKFGIYQDYGSATCEGYPGILGHMEIDANTFAEWGVDYIKVDGCNVDPATMEAGYIEFGKYLNETGRPILYACSWPFFQEISGISPNFDQIMIHCNMWRNHYDIEDTWNSVESIMNYFEANSERLATFAGPGHWNDPDMLVIGNFGLSFDQSKAQLAVWAILAAPFLMSTDLDTLKPEFKDLLLNKNVIAVSQDPLGKAGYYITKKNDVQVWRREVTPVISDQASLVFAFVNHRSYYGAPQDVTFSLSDLGVSESFNYTITDLYSNSMQSWKLIIKENKDAEITVRVNPSGVQFYKVEVLV